MDSRLPVPHPWSPGECGVRRKLDVRRKEGALGTREVWSSDAPRTHPLTPHPGDSGPSGEAARAGSPSSRHELGFLSTISLGYKGFERTKGRCTFRAWAALKIRSQGSCAPRTETELHRAVPFRSYRNGEGFIQPPTPPATPHPRVGRKRQARKRPHLSWPPSHVPGRETWDCLSDPIFSAIGERGCSSAPWRQTTRARH